MAEVIKMPRLSDTMEEGVVAQWLKKVGDKVLEGDILAFGIPLGNFFSRNNKMI